MIDFNKLREQKAKPRPQDPIEIFRRLPKPTGFNDLYTSQADVLKNWFIRRNERDIVVKLHTGGGKTLVGLLMAQSTINEMGKPVLYLAPNNQLVEQTLEKAKMHGIPAVPYERGRGIPLNEQFVNAKAVMVGNYSVLFNGKSKFKLRGDRAPIEVGAIILDDAHAAFSDIRDSFTLEIDKSKHAALYESFVGQFRKSFKDSSRLGTFDDVISGRDISILEVPYGAWFESLEAVREELRPQAEEFWSTWPLLRDRLHLCHVLVSRKSISITPVLPPVDIFPTFSDAPRRIYMSATIADDSEIVRTFGAEVNSVRKPLTSRSLAGISERMVLIPDLMPFEMSIQKATEALLQWTVKQSFGAAILVSSGEAARKWEGVATYPDTPAKVEAIVKELQEGKSFGPVVFANRYDGIDLPGDSCRFLVLNGLPAGTSNYELFRASTLYGASNITRMLAQRIEQGMGRGARGAGDYCVVMLTGSELAAWVSKDANYNFLTGATKAQIEMGTKVSKAMESAKDVAKTMSRSFERDEDWVRFHAETLADSMEEPEPNEAQFTLASSERKAFELWSDGYHEKAIARIRRAIDESIEIDNQVRGWFLQLAARIANHWGNYELSDELQQDAYGRNRNLTKPKVEPPYRRLNPPGIQARALATLVGSYRNRRGIVSTFDAAVINLNPDASAAQFEKSLADLGEMIGISSERYDSGGKGPDVLWLLPDKVALVIEAKSRRLKKNAFNKDQHGQLLVAGEWFSEQYPGHSSYRVSVHSNRFCTEPAAAHGSFVLTYVNLAKLVADARSLLVQLAESQLPVSELESFCQQLLSESGIRADALPGTYLERFETQGV